MQGQGVNETATCSFGNATYVQTVSAQVSDAGNATCMAPEWPAIISNSTNGGANAAALMAEIIVQKRLIMHRLFYLTLRQGRHSWNAKAWLLLCRYSCES